MTDETNSDIENQDPGNTGDEGMLSDFSDLSNEVTKETNEPSVDYNGMALSGILGEDVTVDAQEDKPPEAVQEEENYSDFLKDIGDFDSDDNLEPDADTPALTATDTVSFDDTAEAEGDMDILDGFLDSDMESQDEVDDQNSVTVAPLPEPPTSDPVSSEPAAPEVEEEAISFDNMALDMDEPAPEAAQTTEELEPDVISLKDIMDEPNTAAVVLPSGDLGSDDVTGTFEPVAEDSYNVEEEPEESAGGYGGIELLANDEDIAAEPVADDSFTGAGMVIDDADTTSGDGYASLLDELGSDSAPQEAEESGDMNYMTIGEEDVSTSEEGDELSFVGMDSDEPADSEPEEVSAQADKKPDEDDGFLEFDLGIDDEDTGDDSQEEEQGFVVPSADTDEDDDSLGLSDDSKGDDKDESDDLGIDSGTYSEVLFEAIDMEFDDQALVVTRAELLLAQNRRDEALALFKQIADQGATHWVTKRIEELS